MVEIVIKCNIKQTCPHIVLQQFFFLLESFEGRGVTFSRNMIVFQDLSEKVRLLELVILHKRFLGNIKGNLVVSLIKITNSHSKFLCACVYGCTYAYI